MTPDDIIELRYEGDDRVVLERFDGAFEVMTEREAVRVVANEERGVRWIIRRLVQQQVEWILEDLRF